jgi:hypothetical protein
MARQPSSVVREPHHERSERASRPRCYALAVTTEELIIAAVRVAGALPVLRWAFAGALVAIAVDFSDLFQMNLLELGGVRNYQALDKWLDLAYMATFLIVALRWRGHARTIAVSLLAYRLVGVAAFEVAGARSLLLAFPNVFEFWFLFVAGVRRYRPSYELTFARSLLWLVPVAALKEAHEIVLHGGQWLDDYRAVDVVQDAWHLVF